MKPEYVVVGRIVKTHSVRGAFRVAPETDYPDRLLTLRSAVLLRGERAQRVDLDEVRPLGDEVLMHARDIDSPEQAAAWRGAAVAVPTDRIVDLPPDHYFVFDMLGVSVRTEDGVVLGRVDEVLRTGSNDVYVVRGGHREVLIPAIDSVVVHIDVAAGTMVVRPLAGMLDKPRTTRGARVRGGGDH